LVRHLPRIFLLALLALPAVAHAAVQVTGADGQGLTLAAPAKRIVALAPDLVEMVFDVDAGNTLVGAVDYSDYPEAAKSLPRVGDAFRVDLERLVALKPDLVLVWEGRPWWISSGRSSSRCFPSAPMSSTTSARTWRP